MSKNKNFEKSLKRLQEISNEIGNDEIGLEMSVELYKEGVDLALYCSEVLTNVEQEVFVLQKTFDEKFELTSFEDFNL